MKAFLALSLLAVQLVLAAPANLKPRQTYADAPYTISQAQAQALITCPNGIAGKAGGVVFLVHGTGSTGSETWANGPYAVYLPSANNGYDVCWIDLPGRSLGDAQVTAEYVSQGIKYLASQSATKKVTVIGHSQGGGLNPQWALIFWPSTQQYVSKYFALAGDFKGTGEGLLLCNPLKTPSCLPSIWQQTVGSHYLAAQNSLAPGGGGRALVPTYSIYTVFDDIIQPETPPLGPTSYLQGASIIDLNNPLACAGVHLSDHFTIPFDPEAYGMIKSALVTGNLLTFDRTYCTYLKENQEFNATGAAAILRQAVTDAVAVAVTLPKTFAEPPLKPYVCARGYATQCG